MPTMTNPETGETKEISMEEFMKMMRSGNGSIQQVVRHADGTVTSSLIYGNNIGDGVDRSLNIFGTMGDVLFYAVLKARKIKEADENAEKLFFIDNSDADYEVTIDDTQAPMMHIITCTKEKVRVARYIRDERKSVSKPISEAEYVFVDGKISATLEDVQKGDKLLLFACGVYEIRKLLDERGLLQKLKELDNRSSGIMVTKNGEEVEDESGIKTKIVRGLNRPDLPCMMFGGLFGQDLEDAVMMRPYMDEMMTGAMMSGMSLEEKIEAAENGDPDIMENLAQMYLNGDDEVAQDFKKSAYWWEKLANTGNATGQFNMGLYYAKGCGVKRDFNKAAEWMKKSAENGDDDAPNAAAMYDGAAEKLKKAESGDPAAQAEVAKLYTQLGGSLEQFGTQSDYEEAFKWAKKAADQGDLDGLYCLALCYEHGRGTAVAKTKAAATYEKAAKMGHAPSQWNLAVCYLNGSGYERDEVKGYMWAYQAADQGNELAINGLTYQEKTLEQIIDTYKDPETNVTLEGTQYEGRADRCENFRAGTELTYKITKDKNGDEVIELFYNGGTVGLLSKWNSAALLALLKLDRIKLVVEVKSCIPKSKRGARARNADVHLNLIISEKKPETPEECAKRLAEEEAQMKAEEERKRLEAEVKQKAEAEAKAKREAALRKFKEDHKKWEDECEAVKSRRVLYAKKLAESEKTALENAAAKKHNDALATANDIINSETKRKAAAETALASLGFFKFGEKKANKLIIEDATQKISNAEREITTAESEYKQEIAAVDKKVKDKEIAFRNAAAKEYPMPEEPKSPA